MFTESPACVRARFNAGVRGRDPSAAEIGVAHGTSVDARRMRLHRTAVGQAPEGRPRVFVTRLQAAALRRVIDGLPGHRLLTVGDRPGIARQGIMLDMTVAQDKIGFDASLEPAAAPGLRPSAGPPRQARKVPT